MAKDIASLALLGVGAALCAFLFSLCVFCVCRKKGKRKDTNYIGRSTCNPNDEASSRSAFWSCCTHAQQADKVAAGGVAPSGGRKEERRIILMPHQVSREPRTNMPPLLVAPTVGILLNGDEGGGLQLAENVDYLTKVQQQPPKKDDTSDACGAQVPRSSSYPVVGHTGCQTLTPPGSPADSPSSSPLTRRRFLKFEPSPLVRSGAVEGMTAPAVPLAGPLSAAELSDILSAKMNGEHSESSPFCAHGQLGMLSFSVGYRARERNLVVGVFSASNLPAGTKEPFVRVSAVNRKQKVLPVTSASASTSAPGTPRLHHTPRATNSADRPRSDSVVAAPCRFEPFTRFDPRNPVFNKTVEFKNVSDVQLLQSHVRLSVKDRRNVRRSHSRRIGEVLLPFNELDLTQIDSDLNLNVNLRAETKFWPSTATSRGELLVCLDFPKEHRQTVLRCTILRAVHLPKSSSGELYNVYAKLNYLVDNKLQQKHRSRLQSCSTNVLDHDRKCGINHSVAFKTEGVTPDRMQIIIMLKYKSVSVSHMAQSGEIGRVILSAHAPALTARTQWGDAVDGRATTIMHQLHD